MFFTGVEPGELMNKQQIYHGECGCFGCSSH